MVLRRHLIGMNKQHMPFQSSVCSDLIYIMLEIFVVVPKSLTGQSRAPNSDFPVGTAGIYPACAAGRLSSDLWPKYRDNIGLRILKKTGPF